MIEARVTETIACTCDELLEFVLDPERYARVDGKIGPIDWVRREGGTVEFRFRSRLPGLPGPAPKVVSRMTLTPGERVDVELPAVPANRLANRVSAFSASWVCVPSAEDTTVTRTLRCGFVRPLRWVAEPLVARALQADVEDEIRQAKKHLEADSRKTP
jgi:hypothetical protein